MSSAQPPAGTPYEEIDDWHNRTLLDASGVGTDEAALLAALTGPDEQTRPLAAQALGTTGGPDSIEALLQAAHSDDDPLAVAASAALARRGDSRGVEVLRELLSRPVSTSVVPLAAAGALARQGSPEGYPVVRAGLAADNFLVRIAAAKQLYFFLAPRRSGVPGRQPGRRVRRLSQGVDGRQRRRALGGAVPTAVRVGSPRVGSGRGIPRIRTGGMAGQRGAQGARPLTHCHWKPATEWGR